MHRLKLIGLLVFLVVGLSLACYFVVRNDFGPRIREAVQADLVKTQMQVQALKFARADRLVKLCDKLARDLTKLDFAKALREPSDESKHKEAFAAIARVKPFLQGLNRVEYTPDAILVIKPDGKLIARDRFEEKWGEVLSFPLIKRVVTDGRDNDVWKYREQNERVMTAVAAPILDGAVVTGVLALLYEHNNQMAADDRKLYRTEVAYFHDDKLYGSSLTEPEQLKQIREFFVPHVRTLQTGQVLGPARLEAAGKKYLALAATFDSAATDRAGGFILLASLDEALAPVSAFLGRFPLIAAGFLVVAILLALLIVRSLTLPYEHIEHGVMDIVSGNLEHKFDAHASGGAGALAHALNLIVAQLQGRPPPDREADDMAWADPFFIEDLSPEEIRAHGYQGAAAHKSDLDSRMGLTLSYYEKLFADYMEARRRAGEKQSEPITAEQFIDKVRKNEEVLCHKYQCAVVKFEVRMKEGKVTLKPVPIK